MSTSDFHKGQCGAAALAGRLLAGLPPKQQVEAIHKALLDLVDVPQSWNEVEPTRDRLAGFAQTLHAVLARRTLCTLKTPAKRKARGAKNRGGGDEC